MVKLDKKDIDQALHSVKDGLDLYSNIQKDLATKDAASDAGFQKQFNRFYRVRRNAAWRSAFFTLLQQEKTNRRSFAEILRALYAATGRVEASFASKLAATVDPDKPVIDSIVLKNLNLRLPLPGEAEVRLEKIEALYDQITKVYADFLGTDMGRYLVTQFQKHYPGRAITKIKMLDLVLWQHRPDAV